ncbi:hypothetical protein JTB14_013967 [Gonioctena quinquepunctata]|nr:hypothetical protein JTB14_013967 [Gonioctena quinquepunctata]
MMTPPFFMESPRRVLWPQPRPQVESPPAHLWEESVFRATARRADLGGEEMEFPPSPQQLNLSPPRVKGMFAPSSPMPYESMFDESLPEDLIPPESPAGTPGRVVTRRASQRRIISSMLPIPNITPESPNAWNLSDSFIAAEDSDFRWMDRS